MPLSPRSIKIFQYPNSDFVQFPEICEWHFMMESRALENGPVSERRAAGCKAAGARNEDISFLNFFLL